MRREAEHKRLGKTRRGGASGEVVITTRSEKESSETGAGDETRRGGARGEVVITTRSKKESGETSEENTGAEEYVSSNEDVAGPQACTRTIERKCNNSILRLIYKYMFIAGLVSVVIDVQPILAKEVINHSYVR
jgi:hypothetical protein